MSSPVTKTSSMKKRYQEMMATHEKEARERRAQREMQRDEEEATATKRVQERFVSIFADQEGLDEADSINKGGFLLVQSASEVPIDSPPEQEEILKEGGCEQDEKASETVSVFTEEKLSADVIQVSETLLADPALMVENVCDDDLDEAPDCVQLPTDLPLEEDVLSESVEDDDTPPAEERIQFASSSTDSDLMDPDEDELLAEADNPPEGDGQFVSVPSCESRLTPEAYTGEDSLVFDEDDPEVVPEVRDQDEDEPVAAVERLDEAGSVNKGSSLVQSASKASDHFQPDEYEQEKIPEDEMRQLTTGLRAGISSPSVDDDEFFGGVSQDVASLGEIRAHKALEDKRGRNG